MRRTLLVALFGVALSGCVRFPDTELYAGIPVRDSGYQPPGDPADTPTNRLLRERVQGRFPVGAAEADLMAWLDGQGMTVRRSVRLTGSAGRAHRQARMGPCGTSVRVMWDADAGGRLTRVTADWGNDGCV